MTLYKTATVLSDVLVAAKHIADARTLLIRANQSLPSNHPATSILYHQYMHLFADIPPSESHDGTLLAPERVLKAFGL